MQIKLKKSEIEQRRRLLRLQAKVCERAEKELASCQGPNYERINLMMDLESLPDLNLSRLLEADAFNFAHDINGIIRHMDRSKYPGKLTGCFEPRCSRLPVRIPIAFREEECGGSFDGNQVISDADPGL